MLSLAILALLFSLAIHSSIITVASYSGIVAAASHPGIVATASYLIPVTIPCQVRMHSNLIRQDQSELTVCSWLGNALPARERSSGPTILKKVHPGTESTDLSSWICETQPCTGSEAMGTEIKPGTGEPSWADPQLGNWTARDPFLLHIKPIDLTKKKYLSFLHMLLITFIIW